MVRGREVMEVDLKPRGCLVLVEGAGVGAAV